MSKIVQAVNAMISNPDNITKVLKGNDEYFFSYKDKYSWSMSRREDEHVLWFYPNITHIEELASYEGHEWEDVNMVTYKDSEIGTREARASFAELFTLLKEKVFGVNKVLDDIISDALPF
jgi:hypothetical protein